MTNNEAQRKAFESYISTRPLVKKYGAKLHKSSCNHYKDLRVNQHWITWQYAVMAQVGIEE